MSLSSEEKVIQNIIECSADAKISSAEIDLLLGRLLVIDGLGQLTLSDIKNEINTRYERLSKARRQAGQECSIYDSVREKLAFCRKLYEKLDKKAYEDFISPFPRRAVKIAYWYSNSYAKEALEKFTGVFRNCTQLPLESIGEVCESIEEHSCYGIIPLVNSSDGRLMSFYRLLDKYDLKISAICKVDIPTGGYMKMALVGKDILNADNSNYKTVEIIANSFVNEFIILAHLINAKVGDLSSIPSSYNESESITYLSITAEIQNLYLLWLYIYLFSSDTEFIGFYNEVN